MKEKCQFLIGKVQQMTVINGGTPMKEKCQFLIGKVQPSEEDSWKRIVYGKACQFLIGKVQHIKTLKNIN